MAAAVNLTIRPLTPNLWSDLEDLFGKKGACGGCWCMYFRVGDTSRQNSCLYVRIGYRRRGVTSALIAAALKAARSAGYRSTFARAGFKTVARRVPARPIMRHDLGE